MLRSMYSGITGLKANQTKLDVVGNNIANVGTTAFKSQTIRFKDSLSQTLGTSSAPGNNMGGTNPKQIGLGVQVGGISTLMSQGNMQTTGSNLDVAIDGDGFLMVATGQLPTTNADGVDVDTATHKITNGGGLSVNYTRDGSLTLDAQGNLLTTDGYRVLGYPLTDAATPSATTTSINYAGGVATMNYVNADVSGGVKAASDNLVPLKIPDSVVDNTTTPATTIKIRNFSIEKDGVIKATLADGRTTALGQVAMSSFKNPAGLEKLGKNLYSNGNNSGEALVRSAAGAAKADDNSAGFGAVMNGYLEMSNVDLAEQFTEMIVASRAFQANGKMITTGDEILQELVNLKR